MFTDSEGSFTAKEPRVKVINVQQSGHRTDAVLNAVRVDSNQFGQTKLLHNCNYRWASLTLNHNPLQK